jgi:uncharacterized protein YggT (Ycf19 family)
MTYRDRDAETRVVEHEPVHSHEPVRTYDPAPSNVNVSGSAARTVYTPGPLYYARRVVVVLFGILQVLIALRIILLVLAANAGNALVDFIYGTTEPFVAPFRGIFSIDQVTPNGQNVLDFAAIVALIGWTLIYALIMAILGLADRRQPA